MMSVHKYAAARRKTRGPQRNSPAIVVRVDPLLWAVALDMAEGDASRLRIHSANEVLVLNKSPRPR